LRESGEQAFAAKLAAIAADWFNGFETFRTDRQGGADSERQSAKAAIGGE
jgi:hypothetical protein